MNVPGIEIACRTAAGVTVPGGSGERSAGRSSAFLSRLRRHRTSGLIVGLVAAAAFVVGGTGYDYEPLRRAPATLSGGSSGAESSSEAARDDRRLLAKLTRLAPRGTYLVIDRANNRLWLRRGESILLEAHCSSGSGTVLHAPDGKRTWVFDTPSGIFTILSRIENPAWRKPDWAFIEEGRPVPGRPEDRIEYGALGEYALHFGDGYLIHGTLYERLLGRSVTHGCIRLGRDDLRKVYEAAVLGTPVYVF